jgi:hypothetical protein
MTYPELKSSYGEEVAARMYAILHLEPKGLLVQSLLDFMGQQTLNQWAEAIQKELEHESASG